MLKKPELLATAGTIEELTQVLKAGADAAVIGNDVFGMRLKGSFSVDDIRNAVDIAHALGAKIYINANGIMENQVLDELPGFIRDIHAAGADALLFGDPAVIFSMKEAGVQLPLHWNGEMTTTNYETANYWGKRGAVRAVLARELNMDEVLEFKANAQVEVQVQVHGATNIYHSKRNLLQHYGNHLGAGAQVTDLSQERGLFLIEAERQDERFPVFEDRSGMHIMSSEDICMLENLNELIEAGIDSLWIEGLLKSPLYNETVVSLYRKAIDAYCTNPEGDWYDPAWVEQIEAMQPAERPLSFGFFYKDQVY
ncbi:peptidase U32 family protein [Gorillibacterium massiliense]|uniref:peptidase U32 family protein n=1 Tax=Gorillibacterium massiliense TaxID=1280390 RepID=UPI0004B6BFE0|nr:peptidase U32 family protein [Gorillibacterium massiliense]